MSNDSSKQPVETNRPLAVPWGPWQGIVLGFLGFFIAQFVAVYAISYLAASLGLSSGQALLDSTTGEFSIVLLSDVIVVFALWAYLRSKSSSFRALGFGRSVGGRDVLYAVVGYVVYFALLIATLSVLRLFTGIDLDQKQDLGFNTLYTSPEQVMALISLVILPPFVEETVFRGFLFTGLRTRLPFLPATVATSLLFGGLHLLGVTDGVIWVAAVDTFVLSLILCYLREKTGALWAPIAVHMIKNAVAFIFLF